MEYDRRIAYMDLFCGDEKTGNAGFAKIERRGDRGKITFVMQTPSELYDAEGVAYLLRQTEQGMTGIGIGTMCLDAFNSRPLLFDAARIGGTEFGLQNMCGVYIAVGTKEPYYLISLWNGAAFRQEQFQPWERAQEENGLQEEDRPQEESGLQEEDRLRKESGSQEKGENEEPLSGVSLETGEIRTRIPGERSLWDQIGSHYTKISGRMLREDCECIKLVPSELRCLPRCYWQLQQNSFLLHGYYQYHYVVLLRYTDRGRYRYYAGVPGIQNAQQKKMAEMFGFSEFMEMAERRRNALAAVFNGYWCMELPLLRHD